MADNNVMNLGIKVDDGRRRVPITNNYGDEVGVFYFNPTDINIIERYNKMAGSFEKIFEPLDEIPDTDDESKDDELKDQRAQAINEVRDRLNNAVNELFGGDCAGAFFGSVHPLSPVDGKFYCEVVFEAVGRYISDQFKKETEKVSARINKYTNRFKKK